MSTESSNGWVKLTDPKTARVFYANKITRTTQWEAPAGFIDDNHEDQEAVMDQGINSEKDDTVDDHITNSLAAVAAASKQSSLSQRQHNSVQKSSMLSMSNSSPKSSSSLPLPSNWEMRHDPKTNRPFYIDHDSKVTTWEHPLKNVSSADIAAIMNENSNNDLAAKRYENTSNSRLYATNPQHSQSSRMSFSSTTSRNSFSSTNTHHYQQAIMSKDGESTQYYKRLQTSNHQFSVIEIPDRVRTICPSCKMPFSTLNRRHHCRSCGDVFCHECSKNKVLLPLDGDKYKLPVRVCNSCHVDVSRGNYFTMRRYWTIFDVFNGNEYQNNLKSIDETQAAIALIAQEEDGNVSDYEGGSGVNKGKGTNAIIRPQNVSAAFISLTQDLDTLLQTFHEDDGRSFKEKITLNPKILLHLITKHLILEDTSDVAVKTLATLLSLSNVVYGHNHEDVYVHAFYLLQLETSTSLSLGSSGIDSNSDDRIQMSKKIKPPCNVWNDLCALLEWYGTSSKTIAVQEQAARSLFYLTDPKVISTFLAKEDDHLNENMKVETEKSSPYPSYGEVEDGWATKAIECCDIHRLLKNLLDHTTSTGSTCLQRWSAATFQNLIAEDFRRACDAITNAMLCGNGNGLVYESYTFQLISSGGIMILSSLMGADDSDVRAHATATLSSIITNVRDLNRRLEVWKEATGGTVKNGAINDIGVINAILSSGACGLSLTQLLLSADNSTAIMGCNFALSLVHPILQSPLGSELVSYQRILNATQAISSEDFYAADDSISTYRKAAMELAKNDGILPALIQLARNNDFGQRGRKIPLELWSCAIDVLAAIVLTISHLDAKIMQAKGSSENAPSVVNEIRTSLLILEEEDLGQVLLESLSSIRINAINVSRDSPAAKVRESASLILSATSSCSRCYIVDDIIMSNVMTDLITASAEEGMSSESTFRRGAWAPRYLAMLEAVASVLVYGWKIIQNGVDSSSSRKSLTASSVLDLLLEAIDAGIIPFVSYIIESKIDYHDHDKAYANMRLKIAGLTVIAALFGICQSDKASIGMPRLYEAVYANTGSSNDSMGYPNFNHNGRSTRHVNQRDVISSLLILLRSIVSESQQNMSRSTEHQYQLPHGKLIESCLLAAGSVCGSSFCHFNSFLLSSTNDFSYAINTNNVDDQFSAQFEEVCKLSCDAVTTSSFLPSALVGVFGEGTILPSLRFILALAQHSTIRVHQKLAKSGILVPISDMMSDSLASGDFYVFSLTVELIGLCGSQISASAGESTGLKAIRNSVQLLSNIFSIEDRNNAPSGEREKFKQLKKHCLQAIERLSTNSSTLSIIASSFIPAISLSFSPENNLECDEQFSHILRIIQRVVSIPTYAKAVIDSGIVKSFSELISEERVSDELDHLIVEIIHKLVCHTVHSREYENEKIGLIQHGAVKTICFSLMKHSTINSGAIVSSSILTVKLGFEILQYLLSGIKNIDKVLSLQAACFVKAILSQKKFIKTLCCTLLTQSIEGEKLITKSLYGDPLILFDDKCGTFSSPFEAAIFLLFSIASLCTLSPTNNEFWDTFLLIKESENCVDKKSKALTVFTLCSIFLEYISDESSFLYKPTSTTFAVTRYLKHSLQEKLINGLSLNMKGIDLRAKEDEDILCFLSTFIDRHEIIQISLISCKIPSLIDSAIELIKMVFLGCEDAFFVALGSDEQVFSTLFDLLDSNSIHTRQVVAHILSKAGERGILGPIVSSLRLRNVAIASLSTACLREEEYSKVGLEENDDPSSHSSLCLKALLSVVSSDALGDGTSESTHQNIEISSGEAQAICDSLGKKLSQMVLNQLLLNVQRNESLQNDSVQAKSPEVILLCLLASHTFLLPQLYQNGGLEALSLVAAEGEVTAIQALCEVSFNDPKKVLEVDGHISAMQVFVDESTKNTIDAMKLSMNLLVNISTKSKMTRKVVSESDLCQKCIYKARDIITDFEESMTPLIALYDEPKTQDKNGLELSALSFLTIMNHEQNCRDMIRVDKKLRKSIEVLISSKEETNTVSHATIDFLGSMCCHVREIDNEKEEQGYYSAESITSILLTLLEDYEVSTTARNRKTLASIISAMQSILCHMGTEDQTKSLSLLADQFIYIIDQDYMISLKKLLAQEKSSSALILHLITSIFLRLLYKEEHHQLLREHKALSGFVKLIVIDYYIKQDNQSQIEPDSKEHGKTITEEQTYWYSAVTQSLQCLALLDLASFGENSISIAEISVIKGVDSVNHGDIQQRFLIHEALELFAHDNTDAIRFISSQKILQKLDLCIQ